MVVDVLAPGDQLLVVLGGGEEAAALGVGEAGDHRIGRLAGGVEPAHLEGRLVERQQRLEQVGVVLEVGVQLRLAVLPAAQQPAVGVAHLVEHELGRGARGVEVVVAAEHRAGVGERRDHQRVPGGEPLVVEPGPDPLRARLVERRPGLVEPLGRRRVPAADQVGDVAALEVAGIRDPVVGDQLLRRVAEPGPGQHLADLRPGSRRRTSPPRPRSRRRGRRRTRPRGRASRAAPSRASARRSRASARRRAPGSRAGRRGRAARCRRASSRSGGRARSRRRSSGRSRRRRDR